MTTHDVLTPGAIDLVEELHRLFADRHGELMAARVQRREEIARAGGLDFLAETKDIREGDWVVPAPPPGFRDRRVEITGPTEAKMAINALNSGAQVWMADLEDSNTPHWHNVLAGQRVLRAVTRGTLTHTGPDGRAYALRTDVPLAVPAVRPRGWHLSEPHLVVAGRPAIAALVDVALHLHHNGAELAAQGRGPHLYLPKLQSHHEARLWAGVLAVVEERVGLDPGTIRTTVLIETITAAFEMDEILHALGPYAGALNAGRWDYLFSVVKTFRDCGPAFVLPDRNGVRMTAPFLAAYADLLVATCHRRGAMAIGGMSAVIPDRRDPEANEVALAAVRRDKQREASAGYDGSWVAHPDLVPVCREVFDEVLGDAPNQLSRQRGDVAVTAADLLDVRSAGSAFTAVGLASNVDVSLRYLAAWLNGSGAVAIHGLMEDAATAEIARSQVWQWRTAGIVLDTGEPVTAELVAGLIDEAQAAIEGSAAAADLLRELVLADDYPEFLTVAASARISS